MQAWEEKKTKTWFKSPQEIRHPLQIGFIRILEKPIEISLYLILPKMITAICGTLIPARNKMMFYRDVSRKKKEKKTQNKTQQNKPSPQKPNSDITLFHPFPFHRTAFQAIKWCTFLNEMKTRHIYIAEDFRNPLY